MKAEICGVSQNCLVDTGASVLLILAEMVPNEVSVQPTDNKLRSVTGRELDVSGEVELSVAIEDWATSQQFVVCSLTTGPVLGADFLSGHKMSVDLKEDKLH